MTIDECQDHRLSIALHGQVRVSDYVPVENAQNLLELLSLKYGYMECWDNYAKSQNYSKSQTLLPWLGVGSCIAK